ISLERVDGRHVQDPAPAPRLHHRHGEANQMEGGRQVDRQPLVPLAGAEGLDRRGMPDDGVVHQDVHRAEGAPRRLHDAVDVGGSRKVAGRVDGPHAVGRLEAGGDRRRLVRRRQAAQHHVAARGGEAVRRRQAEALCRPGDEGAPPLERSHSCVMVRHMTVKPGWTGRVYEDFTVGDVYHHPLGRTVLPVDNSWFTLLTQNMNPIHFDHAYAAQTEFGKPLVDSTFTLALVTGQSTIDLSFNVMANLGWDEVRLPNPLFEGDTVYSRSEVLEKRESKSRPNVGFVKVKTIGFKQDGLIVIEFLRTFMVYKRDHVPPGAAARIPEPKTKK